MNILLNYLMYYLNNFCSACIGLKNGKALVSDSMLSCHDRRTSIFPHLQTEISLQQSIGFTLGLGWGIWGRQIQRSCDQWRHMTLKGQTRDPVFLRLYLYNRANTCIYSHSLHWSQIGNHIGRVHWSLSLQSVLAKLTSPTVTCLVLP